MLSREDFADRFQAASRTFWCIAVAVTGDRNRAQDVVQDAAVIALTKLNEFDPRTSFSAWMGQIVRFTALNEARRGARHRASDGESRLADSTWRPADSRHSPVGHTGELRSDQTSFDDRVVKALGDLEDTARACLLLKTIVDMPYGEISRVLDIPEGTAMSHVHRARKTLRERLAGSVPAIHSRSSQERSGRTA